MQVKCPTCHKEVTWEENPSRPFCSERCKLIDLGEWASERYRVQGNETSLSQFEEEEDGQEEKGKES